MAQKTVGVLLFPEFELLDVFGPLEAFGHAKDWFRIVTVAERPGPVTSAQGPRAMADHGFADCPPLDILLVPGGMGTRREVNNRAVVDWIARQARGAETTTSRTRSTRPTRWRRSVRSTPGTWRRAGNSVQLLPRSSL